MEDLVIRLTYFVLQTRNSFVHVREIGLSSAAMHELQQCVFRGGKRVRTAVQ